MSSSNKSSGLDTEAQMFLASEAREYAQGRLDHQLDHHDIRRHAGIVQDEEVEMVLSLMHRSYKPLTPAMPTSFWDTKLAQDILKDHGTKTARMALQTGNYAFLDYLTGLTNYDPDISGVKTLMWLQKWIGRTASINILSGHMGTGKTDFALLLAQIWLHYWVQTKGLDDDVAVLSNITTAEHAETVVTQEQLEERLQDEDKVLVILDEASSHFSGYSGDAQQVQQQFRRVTRMIRKNDGYLIIIGHTKRGKDIHPDIRRLSDYIYKTEKTQATIWETTEMEDAKKSLSGIPPTDWEFKTEEESDWEWKDGDSEPSEASIFDRCCFVKENGERCSVTNRIDRFGFCYHHDDSEHAQRVRENEDNLVEAVMAFDPKEETRQNNENGE